MDKEEKPCGKTDKEQKPYGKQFCFPVGA